jgi:hypothetical protein
VCLRSKNFEQVHPKADATRAKLAAAYELDYFQAIACGHARFIPFCFGQDFQVVFYGYTSGVETEVIENAAYAGARR